VAFLTVILTDFFWFNNRVSRETTVEKSRCFDSLESGRESVKTPAGSAHFELLTFRPYFGKERYASVQINTVSTRR